MTEFSSGSEDNYQVGGSLPADAPSYVRRASDDLLYDALRANKFCYVLNSRQMGKSSLKVQTIQRLQAEGVACAAIDLTRIGAADITAEQWYSSVIDSIVGSLDLYESFDLFTWWEEHRLLSNVRRLDKFIEEILLTSTSQKIVIFIDEIDSVIGLPFKLGDFFALVRECYNRRANHPDYGRLTFVLLGVTTLSDLMQGQLQTPFNIGQEIALEGFQLDECESLVQGLAAKSSNPQALMQAILTWTGGQPFLTQKVCKLVLHENSMVPDGQEEAWVADLVRARVIENWEAQDTPEHLKTIRDRVLYSGDERSRGRLLGLYQQVLGDGIAADDSYEQMQLRLTGLVVKRDRRLVVYNSIYAAVFNQQWVAQALSDLRPAFYGSAFLAWRESGEQQESFLLRGQALVDAEAWAKGKRLSDEDDRFLQSSREVERLYLLQQQDLERQQREVAEQSNQLLSNAIKKSQRRIQIGSVILLLTLLASGGSGTWAFLTAQQTTKQIEQAQQKVQQAQKDADDARLQAQKDVDDAKQKAKVISDTAEMREKLALRKATDAETKEKLANQQVAIATQQVQTAQQQLQEAQAKTSQAEATRRVAEAGRNEAEKLAEVAKQITVLERKVDNVIRQFSIQQTEALVAAIQAGQELKQLSLNRTSETYPTNSPFYALFRILNDIQEKQLVGHQETVRSASFSPDGRYMLTTDNKTTRLWNINGNLISEFKGDQASFSPLWELKPNQASFSPDSRYIVTAQEKTVKLWNINGNLISELKGHQGIVNSVSFSPDGRKIVTASDDKISRLWDINGNLLAELKGHQEAVMSASFSPDSQKIITSSEDETARLWNLDGKLLVEFKVLQGVVSGASFSPDGRHILTVSVNNTARLWDIEGNPLSELKGHTAYIVSASFSPDGQKIITASNDATARLWDIDGKFLVELKGHNSQVNSASFSHDGRKIVTASRDGKTRLWDINGNLLTELKGHQANVNSAIFSPDDRKIITASEDKTARLWNLHRNNNLLVELQKNQQISRASFSPDGQRIVIESDRMAQLWNIEGNFISELKGYKGYVDRYELDKYKADFSPNGKRIVTKSQKSLQLWDIDGKFLAELKDDSTNSSKDERRIIIESPDQKVPLEDRQQANGEMSVNFSFDSQRILIVSATRTVQLWDIDGNLIGKLKGYKASFSPNRSHIVTVSEDGAALLWNLNGKLISELKEPHGAIIESATIGDRYILTESQETAQLWDINGKLISELKGYEGKRDRYRYRRWSSYDSAIFSLDERRILTKPNDRFMQLWDINGSLLAELKKGDTSFSPDSLRILIRNYSSYSSSDTTKLSDIDGNLLAELRGYNANFSSNNRRILSNSREGNNEITLLWDINGNLLAELKGGSASFSPDSRLILINSSDSSVRLWDSDGKLLADLGNQGEFQDASFSSNGQHILLIRDGTVQLWEIPDLDSLISKGCQWVEGYLRARPDRLQILPICQNSDLFRKSIPKLGLVFNTLARRSR